MATANCTYKGQAAFNGGWAPSNGYNTSTDSYIGNGGGYGACQQFTIPSAAGSVSGRSLKITLNLMTLYSSSFTLQYWVTTEGRPAGVNYGSGPPAIKGTTIVSGTYAVSGLNTSNWKAVTFTTPTTSSLPTGGGTYYLWLRATANGVVRASTATYVLNYTAQTACGAPTSFSVSPNPFEGSVTLSWSGAKAGTSNSISSYEIQWTQSTNNSSWTSWAALKTVNSTSTSGSTTDTPGIARGSYEKYRIRTRGSAGSSYYSGWKESNSVRKNSAPGAPTAFSASSTLIASGATITLSWSGASDTNGNIAKYEIQKTTNGSTWGAVKTATTTSTSGSTTVTLSEGAGTTVQFRIRTVDALGAASGYKTGVSVVINSAPTAPTAFSTSSTLIASGGSVTLSWSGASDVNNNIKQYEIQKSTNGGSTWVAVKTVASAATSGSTSATLSEGAGTTVQFRIRTVDALGAASGYKTGVSVVINSTPTAPTAFSVSKTLIAPGESVTLSWSGASDVNNNIKQYEIEESVNGGTWKLLSTVATAATSGSTQFTFGTIIGNTYSYRIRTVDTLGLASGYKTGVSVTINTPPTAPATCTVSKTVYNQGDSVTLSWSGASDVNNNIKQYRVQYRRTVGGVWQTWADERVIASTATNGSCTVTPQSPANHETLQFRVRTEDALGAASTYRESSQVLRDDYTGVKILDESVWKKGYVHVCINGTYVESELYVCRDGTYVKGVD